MDDDMQKFGGVYLPKHEKHLLAWMTKVNRVVNGKLTYQYQKLTEAMSHVKQFRAAIDVGAHCGLWSTHLAERFGVVYAFEPVDLHRRCFVMNVDMHNVHLMPMALGGQEGTVAMHTTNTSSGDSWVKGEGDTPMKRLDDVVIPEPVDFIKLDCEGYECFALHGGEALLKQHHPCVLVEQKPGRAQKFGLRETQAVQYLEGLGAKLRFTMSGDYCLSWD